MYTIKRVVGNQHKEWKTLIAEVTMYDETNTEITDPKDILVQDLIKNFYEVLISYSVDNSINHKQVSLYTLLNKVNSFIVNEKTVEEYMDILSVEFDEFFAIGETLRDIRKPKLIRYVDLWEFGYRAENALTAGVGFDRDLYISDEMIDVTPESLENSLLYVLDGRICFPSFVNGNAIFPRMLNRVHRRGTPFIGVIDFRDFGGFEKEIIQTDQVEILSSDINKTKVKISLNQSCFEYFLGDEPEVVLYKDQLELGNYYYYKVGESFYHVDNIDTIIDTNKTIYIDGDVEVVNVADVGRLTLRQNRTPMLITHGNLHRLEEYKVNEDNTIIITFDHRKVVGLSEDPQSEKGWLNYPANYENSGFHVSAMDFIKYLTLGDSAILYLTERNVSVKKEILQDSGFDNYFLHYRIPQGILFHKDGSIANYKIIDYDEKRALFLTNPPQTRNPIMNNILTIDSPVIIQGEDNSSPLAQLVIHYDYYTL